MSSSSDQQQPQPTSTGAAETTADHQDEEEEEEEGTLLRQTLMTHDECFVYKIPPLATASGYKANDWNLASPIETCGFQVERRNNSLYLLFTLQDHTKLFAISHIDASQPIIRSVEPVTDSSRYFVCQIIQGGGGGAGGSGGTASASGAGRQKQKQKTALLGFGFRDRDVAIDLLGNLQQFTKSIERERQSKNMKVASIPTLEEGQKIHIEIKGMKHRDQKKKTTAAAGGAVGASGSGGPFLLKKPPKSSSGGGAPDTTADTLSSGIDKLKIDEAAAATTVETATTTTATATADNATGDGFDDDDDFGDFQGA